MFQKINLKLRRGNARLDGASFDSDKLLNKLSGGLSIKLDPLKSLKRE